MEIPNEEGDEMAIPLNTYGHGHAHMIHHHHDHHHHEHPPPSHIIIPSSAAAAAQIDDFKKPGGGARYRECLKNHAAAMGGNATDGCGEFMPSGEDGTLEALTCSACSCHRNFHRKEPDSAAAVAAAAINGRKLFHHQQHRYPELYHHHAAAALRAAPPQMIMAYGGGESDDGGRARSVKKRFRTKFSQEQKEKMLNFAEKVGWKIQKQEEGVVQQFCQEVGVKRRVLKVWMHNNKHTLAKKTTINQSDAQIQSLGNDDN